MNITKMIKNSESGNTRAIYIDNPNTAGAGAGAHSFLRKDAGGGGGDGGGGRGGEGEEEEEEEFVNQAGMGLGSYIRAHSSHPVKWQLWSPQTLALAKKLGRVVFLSIGYASCHWCHVMERECFENEEIAMLLNRHFIPIKLDREERPDIDRIYMNFVEATTGSGGWPLNIFLTPDLKPVFGGTYWPGPTAATAASSSKNAQIGFREVLEKIIQTWHEQPAKFLASAEEILSRLREFAGEGLKGPGKGEPEETLDIELLEDACRQFGNIFDPVNGGFGLPPKFPVPVKLAFLLRLGMSSDVVKDIVGERECEDAKAMVMKTLRNMAMGGIHDHVGHGFARYSATADWSLPHFEKMLYDNAQLLNVYLDAWLVTGNALMLDTALDIVGYLCDDVLKNPDGGFFSSEGADSLYRCTDCEKREGAFYVWTRKEFDSILGSEEASICARYWNVHRDGNVDPADDTHDEFIHQNVLSIVTTFEQLGQTFGMDMEKVASIIKNGRRKLCQHRDKERPRPNMDDKIIVSWNGLAIGALARAAVVLRTAEAETSQKCLDNAIQTAGFIKLRLYNENTHTLKRIYHRSACGDNDGFADDYAYLISGLLSLYEATFDAEYLKWADSLQKKQLDLFWDEGNGGFFATSETATDLILRLKDGLDSQEPSTNGISAANLFRLSSLLEDADYARYGHRVCSAFSVEMMEHPALIVSLLDSVVADNLGVRSIIIASREKDDSKVNEYLKKISLRLLTNYTIAVVDCGILDGDGAGRWLVERNMRIKNILKELKEKRKGGGTVVMERVWRGEGGSFPPSSLPGSTFDMYGFDKVLDDLC